jgi:hypothetical protein
VTSDSIALTALNLGFGFLDLIWCRGYVANGVYGVTGFSSDSGWPLLGLPNTSTGVEVPVTGPGDVLVEKEEAK